MTPSLHNTFHRWNSRLMFTVCVVFTVVILALLALVTGYLLSIGAKNVSLDFFTKLPTGTVENPGGMKHALVGTIVLIGAASLIGIPLGMLSGVYLSEYDRGSWLAAPVRFIADVLAGVPSIVVGILGYELVVVPMGHYSGWAGALALAFIMVPIVTRTTEEMLRLVPNSYREASIALGATKATTILQIVVPSATGSIITGVMLAIARVAGETAPLLFTALAGRFLPVFHGPAPYVHVSDMNQQFPSLTVQIFGYATGPYPELKKQAWAGILILIALIFFLNLAIRFTTRQHKPG